MKAKFETIGNLGQDPEIKEVTLEGGEVKTVSNFSVFVSKDKRVSEEGAEPVYEEQWGYWVDASLWGWRAKLTANLKKGDMVFIIGELVQEKWVDETTKKERTKLKLNVSYVALDLLSLDKR